MRITDPLQAMDMALGHLMLYSVTSGNNHCCSCAFLLFFEETGLSGFPDCLSGFPDCYWAFPIAYWAFSEIYWAFSAMDWAFPMLDACLMVHGSWLKAHGSWPRGGRPDPGERPQTCIILGILFSWNLEILGCWNLGFLESNKP